MADSPHTQPSLLLRLRNERDRDAWSRFVEVYGPLVYGYLRKQGVQDADSADIAQDVMADVARSIKTFDYQPSPGAFRRWLFTVVKNRLRNHWRDNGRQPHGTGDTRVLETLLQQPDQRRQETSAWDDNYQRRLFQYAADAVHGDFSEATWRAFWLTAVDGEVPSQVARSLGMTVAAVYLAKARVIARIREQVEMLDGGETCPSSIAATANSSDPR